MITRTFEGGVFPDVVWWQDHWVVASQQGETVAVRAFDSSGAQVSITGLQVGPGAGAFPRLFADGAQLWMAYRVGEPEQVAMLARFDVAGWHTERLTVAEGNSPVAIGYGLVAWQDQATRRIRVRALEGGDIHDGGPWCPVGLSRILPEGAVRTMDEDQDQQLGVTRPAWAGAYVAAEHHDAQNRGLYLLDRERLVGVSFARDQITKTPRVAIGSGSQVAVVAWGDGLHCLLALVEPEELSSAGAIVDDPTSDTPQDVLAFITGDLREDSPYRYPHVGDKGETWDVTLNSSTRRLTAVLAGRLIQVWSIDRYRIGHRWDDWGQGTGDREFEGYTHRAGLWLRRTMRPGDEEVAISNRIRWYDRRTGAFLREEGLPYWVRLERRCAAYPCGPYLGMRPAIVFCYYIGSRQAEHQVDYREENVYVLEWGLYSCNHQRRVGGVWVTQTENPPIDRLAPLSAHVEPWDPPLPMTLFPGDDLEPPVAVVTTTYPRVLTGTGTEEIVSWEDGANPGTGGRVELRNGSVHLRLVNRQGADVTGKRRPVTLVSQ